MLLETNDAGGWHPKVEVDGSNHVLVVWYQSDGARNSVWANRYTPAGGWGTATLVEMDSSGSAGEPALAVDATTGEAVVVWPVNDGTENSVWANRYSPSTTRRPSPFVWTGAPEAILEKVRRGHQALETVH